ncbi:MAG: ArsR/SmtB family transcription factor [Aquificaceae bacterium]
MKDLERFFYALSDETRLKMVRILIDYPEVCVCQFQQVFKTYQPRVSFHLRILREANIIEGERKGKWVYYHIKHLPECIKQMIKTIPLEGLNMACEVKD